MIIVGADYHPGFQQIALVDTDTGDVQERRLEHREEAEKFYRDLGAQGGCRGNPLATGNVIDLSHWMRANFGMWKPDAAGQLLKHRHSTNNGAMSHRVIAPVGIWMPQVCLRTRHILLGHLRLNASPYIYI